MTRAEQLTWRQAGSSYYAETGGRIVALLYWYGAGHYLHAGPDAVEPPSPGWFVVMADEPGDHRSIEAPEPHDLELADLQEATRAALDAATAVVIACLDRASA